MNKIAYCKNCYTYSLPNRFTNKNSMYSTTNPLNARSCSTLFVPDTLANRLTAFMKVEVKGGNPVIQLPTATDLALQVKVVIANAPFLFLIWSLTALLLVLAEKAKPTETPATLPLAEADPEKLLSVCSRNLDTVLTTSEFEFSVHPTAVLTEGWSFVGSNLKIGFLLPGSRGPLSEREIIIF